MQRRWSVLDRQVTNFVVLATHGRDEDLVKELSSIQLEVLKAIATSINEDGNTLLHMAAVKERMESLMILVKMSVDLNAKNGSGRSAVFQCISRNALNSARLLLQAGANVNEIISRQTSETLLHRTVKSNRLKAMELLLDMGADADVATQDGETPLHFAARYDRPETAQLLMDAGADVNAANKDGETALHVAIATKSSEMTRLLIQHKKSDMAAKDRRGMTPLHAAVAGGCLDQVRMMLTSNSAAINSKESLLGRTPLLLACSSGTQRMASLLLTHGADANLTTHYRKSVLHVAASNGNVGALGAVIKFASNPNALSINNMTPLHYAVQGGWCEIVKILLKSGVNANMKDIEGHTALHIASSAGDNESVTALLEHRAQANATNMKQQTPLHLALMNGHEVTGSILIAFGIDTTIQDVFDKTGMDYWEDYKIHNKHHFKDGHRCEIDTFLFPSIVEEETPTFQSSDEDASTKVKQGSAKDKDRRNQYIDCAYVNVNHIYISENDLPIYQRQNALAAEITGFQDDYSLVNGDNYPVHYEDIEYTEDDKMLNGNEHESIAFLQGKIEDVDIEEDLHECKGTELQTESERKNKHKKHHPNHRRVRENSTGKSKKHPTMTKPSKSKIKSKLSNQEESKLKENEDSDCQRKRKVGVASVH